MNGKCRRGNWAKKKTIVVRWGEGWKEWWWQKVLWSGSRLIREGRGWKKRRVPCWKGRVFKPVISPERFFASFLLFLPFFLSILLHSHSPILPFSPCPTSTPLAITYSFLLLLTTLIYDEPLIYLPNSAINLLYNKHSCTFLPHYTHHYSRHRHTSRFWSTLNTLPKWCYCLSVCLADKVLWLLLTRPPTLLPSSFECLPLPTCPVCLSV